MKNYKVYSARKHYHEFNKIMCELDAFGIADAKETLIKEHNLNPFYYVFVSTANGLNTIEYNNFLPFLTEN